MAEEEEEEDAIAARLAEGLGLSSVEPRSPAAAPEPPSLLDRRAKSEDSLMRGRASPLPISAAAPPPNARKKSSFIVPRMRGSIYGMRKSRWSADV